MICRFRQIFLSYKLYVVRYAMDMEDGRIPNRLKRYRRLAGYSQKQVAKALALQNTSCVSRWEKGLSVPEMFTLFRLSILYRTNPFHLYQECWQQLKREVSEREEKMHTRRKSDNSNIKYLL